MDHGTLSAWYANSARYPEYPYYPLISSSRSEWLIEAELAYFERIVRLHRRPLRGRTGLGADRKALAAFENEIWCPPAEGWVKEGSQSAWLTRRTTAWNAGCWRFFRSDRASSGLIRPLIGGQGSVPKSARRRRPDCWSLQSEGRRQPSGDPCRWTRELTLAVLDSLCSRFLRRTEP
jgi:hypothetical protein